MRARCSNLSPKLLAGHLLLASAVLAVVGLASPNDDGDGTRQVEPRWLERLDTLDRTLLDESIGYAPPAIPDDVTWKESEPLTWQKLRGRVVVVQSWSTKTSAGRSAPVRVQRAIPAEHVQEVVVIALHTPEGADTADRFFKQRQLGMPVAIDATGAFCDELGFYKRPANILIDRNGKVRFAGLNTRGLGEALKVLIAEPFNEAVQPVARPKADEADRDIEFPTFRGSLPSSGDLRGRRAPDMIVGQWINGQPNARGKVVVIDFWATWCPPCRKAIPHMNDMAAHYRNDVVCIGLSDESLAKVQNFMRTTPIRYTAAVDRNARMMKAFGVTGIPHVVVISSDWVVRWQGHPTNLNQQVMDKIVKANRALVENDGGRYRWTSG